MYVVRVCIYREFAASGQRVLATSRSRDPRHADVDLEPFGVCDDFFKNIYIYTFIYFSCFLYELARPLAKRARVASGRRDIRVDERATTEIPLAENMHATHTQLATYLYLSA